VGFGHAKNGHRPAHPALYEAVSREREGVRFLLTSGFTGEETLQHTPTTRALPFLPKPWTLNELLEAVRGVLPKS
jgi:hypothetical protein